MTDFLFSGFYSSVWFRLLGVMAVVSFSVSGVQALLEVVNDLFEEQTDLEKIVRKIMHRAQTLLKCERCSVQLLEDIESPVLFFVSLLCMCLSVQLCSSGKKQSIFTDVLCKVHVFYFSISSFLLFYMTTQHLRGKYLNFTFSHSFI